MKKKEPLNLVDEEAPSFIAKNKCSYRRKDNILHLNVSFYIINKTLGNRCKKAIFHVG